MLKAQHGHPLNAQLVGPPDSDDDAGQQTLLQLGDDCRQPALTEGSPEEKVPGRAALRVATDIRVGQLPSWVWVTRSSIG